MLCCRLWPRVLVAHGIVTGYAIERGARYDPFQNKVQGKIWLTIITAVWDMPHNTRYHPKKFCKIYPTAWFQDIVNTTG